MAGIPIYFPSKFIAGFVIVTYKIQKIRAEKINTKSFKGS
jgi:hypothetical protein